MGDTRIHTHTLAASLRRFVHAGSSIADALGLSQV